MQRSPTARLLWACTAALAITLAAHHPGMAQEEQVSICHSTGSAANPWVFMTIDPRTWSEHQAHGDFRATSLADCSPPTPAAHGPVGAGTDRSATATTGRAEHSYPITNLSPTESRIDAGAQRGTSGDAGAHYRDCWREGERS